MAMTTRSSRRVKAFWRMGGPEGIKPNFLGDIRSKGGVQGKNKVGEGLGGTSPTGGEKIANSSCVGGSTPGEGIQLNEGAHLLVVFHIHLL
jgi:hypothetical protein